MKGFQRAGSPTSLAACCLDGSGAERSRREDERREREREGGGVHCTQMKGKDNPTNNHPTFHGLKPWRHVLRRGNLHKMNMIPQSSFDSFSLASMPSNS